MSDPTESVCRHVLTRINAVPARSATRLVAIDGRGGSGKTYLARRLRKLDPAIRLLPVDHFPCLVDEYPLHASGVQTRISEHRLLTVLRPLTEDFPAFYRRTAWDGTDPGRPPRRVAAGGTVILEGTYSLLPAFRPLLDLSIWIECDSELALARAIDREEAWFESAEWEHGHGPAQEEYIRAHEPAAFADLVISVDEAGVFSLDA